jgi:hypothetical protein
MYEFQPQQQKQTYKTRQKDQTVPDPRSHQPSKEILSSNSLPTPIPRLAMQRNPPPPLSTNLNINRLPPSAARKLLIIDEILGQLGLKLLLLGARALEKIDRRQGRGAGGIPAALGDALAFGGSGEVGVGVVSLALEALVRRGCGGGGWRGRVV